MTNDKPDKQLEEKVMNILHEFYHDNDYDIEDATDNIIKLLF